MITETRIDHALNRLIAHFGRLVVVRPHVGASDLAELETLVGSLPRDLTILLSTCTGVRFNAGPGEPFREFWHWPDMLRTVRGDDGPGLPAGLVPVCGDPNGEMDCVMAADGPMHGAVLRWDASAPQAAIIASCFGAYFAAWVEFWIGRYDPRGRRLRGRPKRVFGADDIGRIDAGLARLQQDPAASDWVAGLRLLAPCGDDFE